MGVGGARSELGRVSALGALGAAEGSAKGAASGEGAPEEGGQGRVGTGSRMPNAHGRQVVSALT